LLIWAGTGNHAKAVIEHILVEGTMIGIELVRTLRRLMAGKYAFLSPIPACNVDSPALHEVPS
jgi:hypothetical protein